MVVLFIIKKTVLVTLMVMISWDSAKTQCETDAVASCHRRTFHVDAASIAFVGVTASLFNHDLGKRKQDLNNSQVQTRCSFDRRHFGRIRASVGESPPTQNIIEESDTQLASQLIVVQSLNGGASGCDVSKANSICASINVATEEVEVNDTKEQDTHLTIHVYTADKLHNGSSINSSTLMNETVTINTTDILLIKESILVGVGMSKSQFTMGVYYHLNTNHSNHMNHPNHRDSPQEQLSSITNQIQSYKIDFEHDWEVHRSNFLELWKEERLICENTSILSPKKRIPKRSEPGIAAVGDSAKARAKREEEEKIKGDNFRDALASYAERMATIVQDELTDTHYLTSSKLLRSEHEVPSWNNSKGLLGWVEQVYGKDNTQALLASSLLQKSETDQLTELKSFLEWFKLRFPYYHDECLTCGASCGASPVHEIGLNSSAHAYQDITNSEVEQDGEEDVSFIGYIYPSIEERLGNASRTELYRCRSCDSFTRFPRYNKALWIAFTQRGRCGEYSMLLYRILRSLGYKELRWVVDWADHVWVDVRLGDGIGSGNKTIGRWVHCDPCEASIDEPLLYKSWGKNQTYILAFFDPFNLNGMSHDGNLLPFPLIEDVTSTYTTDEDDVIFERRGMSNEFVTETIKQVSMQLSEMLNRTFYM